MAAFSLQNTTGCATKQSGADYLYAMEDWAEAVLLRDLKESSADSLDESRACIWHLLPWIEGLSPGIWKTCRGALM